VIHLLKKIKNKVANFSSKGEDDKIILRDDQNRVLTARKLEKKTASVLFYTTHKCASTFMSKLLIKLSSKIEYDFNDYANAIWDLGDNIAIGQGNKGYLLRFLEKNYDRLFYQKGEIYGPLRFPVNFPNRQAFKHIFFLRDPRDVIVSSYYSFGFSHPLPTNNMRKKNFLSLREEIQKKGIDQHALDFADELITRYNGFRHLRETCDGYIYLRYDEFANDTRNFILNLAKYLNVELQKQELDMLCKEAAPIQENIKDDKHKRSGKSRQFISELKPETQAILNDKFRDTLKYWEFED